MIIGITGNMRSGKDTMADVLNKGFGFSHCSFAGKMKECLQIIFGWSPEYIEDHKDHVDPKWGVSPRQVLQIMGTEFGQFMLMEKFPEFKKTTGRKLWSNALLNSMSPAYDYAISDVRFLHEVEAIRDVGGIIVKIVRPNYPVNTSHASEQDIPKIKEDYKIVNDGTLMEYMEAVSAWAEQTL
jgi:hypothetical protein